MIRMNVSGPTVREDTVGLRRDRRDGTRPHVVDMDDDTGRAVAIWMPFDDVEDVRVDDKVEDAKRASPVGGEFVVAVGALGIDEVEVAPQEDTGPALALVLARAPLSRAAVELSDTIVQRSRLRHGGRDVVVDGRHVARRADATSSGMSPSDATAKIAP